MTELRPNLNQPESLVDVSDDVLQALLLEGVSRTFALTIPQLPAQLYPAVANAYLLCRIVDTIEDEVSLTTQQKQFFCDFFIQVVKTGQNATAFSEQLFPLLSEQTIPAEHSLIQLTPRVIAITHGLNKSQILALVNCVEVMAKGMPLFQNLDLHAGLKTMAEMDNYCYYVAGCVGEMLAKLFCDYSPDIAKNQAKLLELSVSFGQGLQMTNILKDIWDDAQRGVCWLPQDIFNQTGFDLATLTPETKDEKFQAGLSHLIGIAQQHLNNALQYTLLIPCHETGIRKFCLWALGMAVLTLRKIKQNLSFTQSKQVKINRNSVKATLFISKLAVRHDTLLTLLFNTTSQALKTPDWHYVIQPPKLTLE